MPSDDDMVTFEVGRNDELTEWRVSVKCKSGLSEEEFAAALQSLSEDILKGDVSWEGAEEVKKENVDPDLH